MKINKKIFLSLLAIMVSFSASVVASEKISVAQAFYELASKNDAQRVESLLHRGYSIESTDSRGYNAVCLSVIKQNKTAYKVLTSYGAKEKPQCLEKIPETVYNKFFGVYPKKTVVPAYTPDKPYLIGTAALGAGALAAAVIFKGDTGGSSDGDNPGEPTVPDEPNEPDEKECPPNSKYNQATKKCDCNTGYEHFGDENQCYSIISNCEKQSKDVCNTCASGYVLKNNICYKRIDNCENQDGDKCLKCYNNFGIHQGDGTVCYQDILNCSVQNKDECEKCNTGYGTHGNPSQCYKNIEHCANQVQDVCKQCEIGYSTYGDPMANVCYAENPCKEYANTVPVNIDGVFGECICDANRGYTGEKENCTQTEDGGYQEGDGSKEEWNNENAVYCNSHGEYSVNAEGVGSCACYDGYKNTDGLTIGCSACDVEKNYGEFGIQGKCFFNLNCGDRGEGLVQHGNECICDKEYISYDDNGETKCAKVEGECEQYHHHEWNSTEKIVECVCNANFNEECTACLEGYELDAEGYCEWAGECTDGWTGAKCDICPVQYEQKVDENGEYQCKECAENRAPYDAETNADCMACADGYRQGDGGECWMDGCSLNEEGYITIGSGCYCDEENGYYRNSVGKCDKKEPDLIGTAQNINNSTIEVVNNGIFRDVYGMKPLKPVLDENGNILVDENGNEVYEYYDDVYNAQALNNSQVANINITNLNSGENNIYGIYTSSATYNAASINTETEDVSSKATIKIEDNYSSSLNAYGIYNMGDKVTYNAYAFNSAEGTLQDTIESKSIADILITRGEGSVGDITGIYGEGTVNNSYAVTSEGIGANVETVGKINVEHKGIGNVSGIINNNNQGKTINSIAYMDSAVSNAVSEGVITATGNGNVYGINAQGTIINSETQFNKKFNKIGDNFSSKGEINVTSNAMRDEYGAYGIYVKEGSAYKSEIYNAMGYNSTGIININSTQGANAYGIYSNAQTYVENDENNNSVTYYNNIYNAFRSSSVYGGDDAISSGNINITIEGNSRDEQEAAGIYGAGNVFNSFANSGSDVKLIAEGNIDITDKSDNLSIKLKGIESSGNLIANAYATGSNKNSDTMVTGNINVTTTKSKTGTSGLASGIYSGKPVIQSSSIYNAALVNDNSNVIGKINVISRSYTLSKMYGIYASGDEGLAAGDTTQPKYIYNAYYKNDDGVSDGHVYGEINVESATSNKVGGAEYYGIYVKDGGAYNAFTTNENADVTGVINVNVAGSQGGTVVGMYGDNSILNNSGNSTINVKTQLAGSSAYGIKGDNKSQIYNNADINVTSDRGNAYGLYINKGTAYNDIDGKIVVSGKDNTYGIYAISEDKEGGDATVVNNGLIELNGKANNVGIYASGNKATVTNTGTIKINGTDYTDVCSDGNCNANVAIVLENGAVLNNGGIIASSNNIDLSQMGGSIKLLENGSIETTEAISGNLDIATSTITNNFEDKKVLENALVAEDINNLNISSDSYLYEAQAENNNDSSYNVVMKMKDFSEITDSNMSEYLKLNYANSKNVELFNLLKSTSNKNEYNQVEADMSGKSVLPNITQEELKVMRSLDTKMISDLFKEGGYIRKFVGADSMYIGRDDMGTLSGYDIMSQSMYALYDKRMNNNYRLGLGMSFTHSDTDYNNDSNRKNFMVQGYVPLTYSNNNGLTAVSMARLGYADGDYSRHANNRVYEADTKQITYGLLNELRYTMNIKGIKLTPYIGLNAIGWYQDDINEGDDNLAINMASSHVFSLESALGMYLDKDIEFNEDNRLNIALGVGYYHEFADPYKGIDAQINNTIGDYRMRHHKLDSRNRGILSAKVNYDYKDFSFYGELLQYLEDEYPINIDVGIKYKF